MQPVSFITFSDVHNGAKSPESMVNEFYNDSNPTGFFPVLTEHVATEEFLGVFLTGDYFDKKLDMNSREAQVASHILFDIYTACRTHNKWFIILRGTYSHDFDQLGIFKQLENEYERFKIISTVTELELLDSYDRPIQVLCLPEEYMEDQEAYYADYLQKSYHIILGHGMCNFNAFQHNESERPMDRMPIFDEVKLMSIADIIVFGHIHTPGCYKDQYYSNGSYSRLCHNEEHAKGFWLFAYDPEERSHGAAFCENTLAPKYVTIHIGKALKKKGITYENLVKIVEEAAASVDYLKVKIDREIAIEYAAEVDLLKRFFTTSRKIHIEAALLTLKTGEQIVLDGSTETAEEDGSEIAVAASDGQYDFLLSGIPVEEKVLTFIHTKHADQQFNITLDDVREALSPSTAQD